ncbi:MAG: hypothetical protein ACAI35_07135, partial [Candidatus Methylacidiphilales bacterium]
MPSAAALGAVSAEAEAVKSISITTNTFWRMSVEKDGSGEMVYGSNIGDGAAFDKDTVPPAMMERFKRRFLEKKGQVNYATVTIQFENGNTKTCYVTDKEFVSELMLMAAKKA